MTDRIKELRAQGLPIWKIAVELNLTVWQVNHKLGGSKEAQRLRKYLQERREQAAVQAAVDRDMEAMRWL